LTKGEIRYANLTKLREQTEAKTPKTAAKQAQNVQSQSNFKEYHSRYLFGAVNA